MTPDRPVDNAPYHSLTHGGLTIEGWSRAAVQSYWRIPELKLGFDLGAQPWDFMGTPTWFVSHTHLDHIAALPVYVARRRMMKMEPPTIYVPAESVDDVQKLLLIMQRLDRGRQICDLSGVDRRRRDRTVARARGDRVRHRPHDPDRGFVVWERRNKLKEEFVGLPGDKIRDLQAEPAWRSRARCASPLVAYTGDTVPGRAGRVPGVLRGEDPHHRDELHPRRTTAATRSTSSGTCTWTTSWSGPTGSRTS